MCVCVCVCVCVHSTRPLYKCSGPRIPDMLPTLQSGNLHVSSSFPPCSPCLGMWHAWTLKITTGSLRQCSNHHHWRRPRDVPPGCGGLILILMYTQSTSVAACSDDISSTQHSITKHSTEGKKYYQNYCIDSNQILHSNKSSQIAFNKSP